MVFGREAEYLEIVLTKENSCDRIVSYDTNIKGGRFNCD